jgi:hypothetical protein
MSTTTPFRTKGRGNGLNYCVNHLDVTDFDHWVTLSGHKKGDGIPSQESINDSLVKAFELYYMLDKVRFLSIAAATSLVDSETGQTFNTSAQRADLQIGVTETETVFDPPFVGSPAPTGPTPPVEPFQRSCRSFIGSDSHYSKIVYGDNVTVSEVFYVSSTAQTVANLLIEALYDDSKLMGYALRSSSFYSFVGAGSLNDSFINHEIAAGVYLSNAIQTSGENEIEPGYEFRTEFAYIEIQGYHFLSVATVELLGFFDTPYHLLSPENPSAECNFSQHSVSQSVRAEILGFDFYEIP